MSIIGGNAKLPLARALSLICSAYSNISSGSAVDALTNSTGKSLPPGRAGGVTGITVTPLIFLNALCTNGLIYGALRFRSLHLLKTMPLKPKLGYVSWKL